MAAPLTVRLTRRLLAVTPGLAPAVLWLRRRRVAKGVATKAHVLRVLPTKAAVRRHGAVVPHTLIPSPLLPVPLGNVRNARVLAQPGAVITADWSLLWPYSPQLKRSPYGADVVWKHLPPPGRRFASAFYAGADGFSYYHWVTGTLPKLLLARLADQVAASEGGKEFDAYLVNPRHKGQENFQTETLRLLGIPVAKTVWLERRTHVLCDELTVPPEACVKQQTALEPWARQLLREAFLPRLFAEPRRETPAKIFISRAKARRRRLHNEAAVVAGLTARGFVPVFLEEMSFLEQVRLFAQAESVVALHGAGLTNLIFAAPGTRVVEIASDAWRNPCFERLAALGDLPYRRIQGRAVGPRHGFAADVRVDATDWIYDS